MNAENGALEIDQVHKRYGDVAALRGVSLEVHRGQFLTLLGPSGSGKTTLLHLIAGFLAPDGGRVIERGKDISHVPAHKRGFGMVFQNYALFPHMTVGGNVEYPLRMRGLPRRDRHERVTEFLRLVEMEPYLLRYPGELSGGQRQRVALARALVFGPSLLLMDEPLGALDRRLRQSIQFRIKRIQKDLHATVIHVTHDQEEALAMSDRVAVMHDGVVEQVGSPEDLYLRPSTPFVASFMGETNRLNVDVLRVDDSSVEVAHAGVAMSFGTDGLYRVPALGPALLYVRPESVRVSTGGHGLPGRLLLHTFMGDHWRFEIEVGSTTVVAKQAAAGGSAIADSSIAVTFDPSGVQIFPAGGSTTNANIEE